MTTAPVRGGGRPGGYYIEGTRIPSTSTVNSFMNPKALFYWHWQNGWEGREYGVGPIPAAEIGTEVHTAVECTIHGEPVPELSCLEAITAYEAWREWWEGQQFEVLFTELPLVSAEHRFGGTPDAIMRDRKGRLCIGDWKSSSGIYGNYLRQVASYGLLWNENNEEQITGGFHIARFDKEMGDFEHRFYGELDDAAEFFLLLRRCYDLDKRVAKRAR